MVKATPFALAGKIFSFVVLGILILTLVLILKKAPAPNVQTSPAAALQAERKLAAADQATSLGQTAEVQLNSAELNSYLAEDLQLAGSSDPASGSPQSKRATPAPQIAGADPQTVEAAGSNVKEVKVYLDGDVVTAYVIFNVHGADLSLQISGHLYTKAGYLRFDPIDGKIGSFPLPQSALHEAVQRMMESPENRDKLKLPDGIDDIEVENSQVVISYK